MLSRQTGVYAEGISEKKLEKLVRKLFPSGRIFDTIKIIGKNREISRSDIRADGQKWRKYEIFF